MHNIQVNALYSFIIICQKNIGSCSSNCDEVKQSDFGWKKEVLCVVGNINCEGSKLQIDKNGIKW